MGRKLDLTGQQFGHLVVLREDGKNKKGQYRWRCRCDCGKEFTTDSSRLIGGHTKSCGCIRGRQRKYSASVYTIGDVGIHIVNETGDYFWFSVCDLDYVLDYNWTISCGRASTIVDGKSVFFYRLVLGVTDSTVQIDHINRDTHDNRRENLRICSLADNNRNRWCEKGYFKRKSGRFTASLTCNGRRIYLGTYDTEAEARAAYLAGTRLYRQEFAIETPEDKEFHFIY